MTDSPTVSIVIPTLGVSESLKEALLSVRNQSYSDYEIIVVDSTSDRSVEEVVVKEPKVKYLRSCKRGVSGARNDGVFNAKGKYIAFLDGDDVWYPHHLADQVKALELNPEVGVSFANVKVEEENGLWRSMTELSTFLASWLKENGIDKEVLQSDEQICIVSDLYPTLLREQLIHTSSVVLTKDVFEEHHGFDEEIEICEDWDLWLRILSSQQALFHTKIAGEYRFNAAGLSGTSDSRHAVWNIHKMEILIKHLDNDLVASVHRGYMEKMAYSRFMAAILWCLNHDQIEAIEYIREAAGERYPDAMALTDAVAALQPGLRLRMANLLVQGLWELEIHPDMRPTGF